MRKSAQNTDLTLFPYSRGERGNYYPFGSSMVSFSNTEFQYSFGFNGMEKDNEMKGEGNSLDFGARIYDSRLGRWLAVDKLKFKHPYVSPYNFVLNKPLLFIDPNGKDVYIYYMRSGDKFDFSHTAVGQGYNNKITYFAALGNFVHYYIEEVHNNDGSMSEYRRISEVGTMKLYMDMGDVVFKYRIKFDPYIETQVQQWAKSWAANPGSADGWPCTKQVKNLLKNSFLSTGYSETDADKMTSILIDYYFPTQLTEREMFERGFDSYDLMYKDEKIGRYIHKTITFTKDGKKITKTVEKEIVVNEDKTVTETICSETTSKEENIRGLSGGDWLFKSSKEKRKESKEVLDKKPPEKPREPKK
jgi:RHS repeat-associated protein